jgi:hypothetical protein
MSAWRSRLEMLLTAGSVNMSSARREWVRAAIAEIQALPEGESALRWSFGAASMIVRDLGEQALLPWRREKGRSPPARFIAAASFLLLLPPAFGILVAAPQAGWLIAALAAASLSAWMNVGAVVQSMPLSGLLYVVSLRLRPLNLLLLASAGGIAAMLISHSSPFY